MRRLIAQQFQVSGQNDFALLRGIGGECAGAVTFLQPGVKLPVNKGADDVHWLKDEEVVAILDELPRRPMLAGKDGLRLSLAGAQDKLPVVFDGNRIGLPRNDAPSSHILKPPIHSVEGSVINEGFCMALAETMKLKPAKSTIQLVSNRSFLLVERYDRIVEANSSRLRLQQEDFRQALSVVPEMKYQHEGGPDFAQCFELLRRATRPAAPHVLRFFDAMIFNALIGNHDAHSKNFSLLYVGKTTELAPLYDLLSTAIHPTLTPKMAMKIGSRYKFSEVQARHWEQFVQVAGLGRAQSKKRILEIAKQLPAAARRTQQTKNANFADSSVVESIIELIDLRCALTLSRLTFV
jgi:serine/threonine-protein kinase HipA